MIMIGAFELIKTITKQNHERTISKSRNLSTQPRNKMSKNTVTIQEQRTK